MASGYRQIDHTGDIGIWVTASDMRELFAMAARAMFEIVADLSVVRPKEKWPVAIEAEDTDALLVRWLSELNFMHITQEKLFCRFNIRELTGTRVVAEVFGETIDPDRHTIYTEIKAVTFHGLHIRETAEGVEAQIIFDM
ncbi:MAG: archease [candidate division KSB1 bacterium]|nr:archease [candidate division KSB1 bacterium]